MAPVYSGASNTRFNTANMAVGASDDGPLSPHNPLERSRNVADISLSNEPEAQSLAGSQQQLNEYRERLARDLERRELSARGLLYNPIDNRGVSPIQEEILPLSQPLNTAATNTSTESNATVRGGMTPAYVAGTPSYPFPRMGGHGNRPYGYQSAQSGYRPSPTSSFDPPLIPQDRVLSNNSTPWSPFSFHPPGASPGIDNPDFPTPNLYDLSLMLSAEPGLDAWWNTVVQIMKDVYQAERVTLAVPADATDIENVPWGQKATYNEHEEDERSLGYLGRNGSTQPSDYETPGSQPSKDEASRSTTPMRPELYSRHSFTSYEDKKDRRQEQIPTVASRRPSYLKRSASHLQSGQMAKDLNNKPELSQDALAEHDQVEDEQTAPSWEAPFTAAKTNRGRVLPVLQALSYEADPLIDHTGVTRVLERGRAVTLTRSYPYLENTAASERTKSASRMSSPEAAKKSIVPRTEMTTVRSSIFGDSTGPRSSRRTRVGSGDKDKGFGMHLEDVEERQSTPKYEEYEQAPPSPWSQSPAPSPAIRTDTKENPFFTDATVDEDSFNPGSGPATYSDMPPPEAIGMENSWTVLHIPLPHVLSSKPSRPFKLSSTALNDKGPTWAGDENDTPRKAAGHSPESPLPMKAAPIAILSILTPIIPYPSNLRRSLEHLAPHMATSFSLCRHYENLETELAGIQRRRLSAAGFGAVAPDGRPLTTVHFSAGTDFIPQFAHTGSITSPSDYSGVSKSITASPAGTPGWDQGSLGSITDKRQPAVSPAAISHASESYFSSKDRPITVRHETFGSAGQMRNASKENSLTERRHRPSSSKTSLDIVNPNEILDKATTDPIDMPALSSGKPQLRGALEGGSYGAEESMEEQKDKVSERSSFSHPHHGHTMLHTHGADFSSTFQSLPPNSSVSRRPPSTVSGSGRSITQAPPPADLKPPTDRLKGLMLDSLPAQVFVALPQTGEVVWVNSRYLFYRGQTVADLTEDPWSSIHPDDRDEYLRAWGHSLRTGEQFSQQVRIKRFDGQYRWFHARAVGSKDKYGTIVQFIGSYMDIHDQYIAEKKADHQREAAASEAKHRLLANLIPQIIFTATEAEGITFANQQWLSYTGQDSKDYLGLGFLDYVHPEDLAQCRFPLLQRQRSKKSSPNSVASETPSVTPIPTRSPGIADEGLGGMRKVPSRHNSSSSTSSNEVTIAELSELARKGIIKITTDSSGRLSYTTEVRLRSKSGEYRWHLIRCVEIDTIDFGSGASSYFGSATDINDHKILETKLKEAMESKGRFLSNMSHEIRTPLIGISGMVSFLQDTVLNEEQRDYTNTIQTSANSLIMIINDILDLSKVDAGMMKLKFEWFHTRSLIEDVNELVSTMAIAKGLELNYLVEADVPAWVKGDKVRIRQVLLNVIGNAIKFTSKGEVFSRCRVYTDDSVHNQDHEIMLEYAIIDTGQGFTEQEAQLIFKPFSQIDGSSTRQHGGSGLGLVISKQLVELHGGTMAGTATPGKGSKFVFTARFALPTADDHPDLPSSPSSTAAASTVSRQTSTESVPNKTQDPPSPKLHRNVEEVHSTSAGQYSKSPSVGSNGSSNLSTQSNRSPVTDKSSVTSVNTGLARFSEAAKASGQDLSQMKLEMPSGRSSPGRTATPSHPEHLSPGNVRPPIYSILIICPQKFSREATTQHIEMTLPADVPHQITALATVEEAQKFIGGEDPIKFTHVVINLGSAEAVVNLMSQITRAQKIDKTTIVVLSDSVQKQAVLKLVANNPLQKPIDENQVTFIYKPVKPSRFAVIFDPDKMRDLSIDRNRSTAQKMVESQKASYLEIEKRMGNKGYKVLLVEDNPVNQKVLMKYLKKIGVDVDVAVDGAECTDMVLSKPHSHYSLILCDLHMPRKDGYQACREIRQWEQAGKFPAKPIIALSANVMSDVHDKCVAAGFSDYVTKPVDFIDLSRAMAKFF